MKAFFTSGAVGGTLHVDEEAYTLITSSAVRNHGPTFDAVIAALLGFASHNNFMESVKKAESTEADRKLLGANMMLSVEVKKDIV